MVGEFVVSRLVRTDTECLGATPLLPFCEWSQEPGGVGLVLDGKITCFLASNISSEWKYL